MEKDIMDLNRKFRKHKKETGQEHQEGATKFL